jgi:hypothetical protein
MIVDVMRSKLDERALSQLKADIKREWAHENIPEGDLERNVTRFQVIFETLPYEAQMEVRSEYCVNIAYPKYRV